MRKKELTDQEVYDVIYHTIQSKIVNNNVALFPEEIEAMKTLNHRSIKADAELIVDILFDEI